MDRLLEIIGASGTLTILFLALLGFFTKLYEGLQDPDMAASRKPLIARLRQDGWARATGRYLSGRLNRLDKLLAPDEIRRRTRKDSPARGFSRRLADITLVLAFAYPVLALFAQWIFSGEGRLGDTVLVNEASIGVRAATLGVFLLSGGLYLWSARSKSRWRILVFILATGILLGWLGLVASQLGAVALAGAVIVAIPFAVAIAVPFAAVWLDRRYGPRMIHSLGLTLVLLGTVLVAIWVMPALPDPTRSAPAWARLLFFGLLPLMNALADFASIGATRYLLRLGLKGRVPLVAPLDALIGAAIFAALGCGLIAILTFIGPGGEPLIDLYALFRDLRADPSDYWWLGAMLISTILPTALHLGLGIVTLFTVWPSFARSFIADQLEKANGDDGDILAGRMGRWGMTVFTTLSVWLPIAGLYVVGELAWLHWHGFIRGLIEFFADFHALIAGPAPGTLVPGSEAP